MKEQEQEQSPPTHCYNLSHAFLTFPRYQTLCCERETFILSGRNTILSGRNIISSMRNIISSVRNIISSRQYIISAGENI